MAFFSGAFATGSTFLMGVEVAAGFESKNEKKPPLAGAGAETGVASVDFTGSAFFDGSGAFAAGFGGCGVDFTGVAGAELEPKNEKKPPAGADSSFFIGVGGVATGFTGSTFFGGSGAFVAGLAATGVAIFRVSTFLAG